MPVSRTMPKLTAVFPELTDTSEQTVMVDIPQEETEPLYPRMSFVNGRHGLRTVSL